MGWEDTLGALTAPPTIAPPTPTVPHVSAPPIGPAYSTGGGTVTRFGGISGSSGGGGFQTYNPPSPFGRVSYAKPAAATTPALPPEQFKLSLPFSSVDPNASPIVGGLQPATFREHPNENPIQATIDPIQQTFADMVRPQTGGLNAGNFATMPYQIFGGTLDALNKSMPNNGAGSFTGEIAEPAFNAAMDLIKGVAGPLNAVMSAPERILRDSSLTDRAQKYAALVSGAISPMQLAGSASPTPIYMGQAGDPIEGLKMLIASITGTSEEQQRKITAATFDLPESVKNALSADPSIALDPNKLNKLLDEAGRQWSYQPNLVGLVENAAPGLAILTAEIVASGGLAGGLRAAGAASTIPGVAGVTGGIARGLSIAAQLNKVAVTAGTGLFAATAVLDAVGRYTGNQDAVNFATNAWSYHPISENPDVMFLTAFTVNPFHAVAALKNGVMKLGGGAEIQLGKVLGGRYAQLYAAADKLNQIVGHVYGVGEASVPEAMTKYFKSRGEAVDHIVNLGAQVVLDRQPADVRNYFATSFSDPRSRAVAVMTQFGPQIMDTIDNQLGQLSQKVQQEFHVYANNVGPYRPDLALASGMGYRGFKDVAYRLMDELDAVAAYPSIVIPEATQNIRAAIAGLGDRIPAETIDNLTQEYKGIGRYVTQFARPTDGFVARADYENAIANAEADFNRLAQRNPILTKSGVEPVLHADSPVSEYARALGTTPEVVAAIREQGPGSADVLRPFLESKADLLGLRPEQIATMAPEEVSYRALEYYTDTTEPWLTMGQRIEGAQKMSQIFRDRAAEAVAMGNNEEAKQLLMRAQDHEDLIRSASGPLVPFTATLRNAANLSEIGSARMRALAADKVDAMRRLDAAQHVLDQVSEMTGGAGQATVTGGGKSMKVGLGSEQILGALHRTREGNWVFDVAPPVPNSIVRKLSDFLPYTTDARVGLTEADNRTIWQLAKKYDGQEAAGRRFSLTQAQRRSLANARPYLSTSIEDFMPMGKALGNEETFLQTLANLREQYDDLLGGTPRRRLEKSYGLSVPQPYLEHAQANASALEYGYVLAHDYVAETEGLRNIAGDINAALDHPNDPAIYGTVADLVDRNPTLADDLAEAAIRRNVPYSEYISNPAYAEEIRAALPNIERSPTPLDEALMHAVSTGDRTALTEALNQVDIAASLGRPRPPAQNVTLEDAVKAGKGKALSDRLAADLRNAQADLTALPNPGILARDPVGREVMSLIGWGFPGQTPAHLDDVLTILREIEGGNAEHAGFGPEVLAKAQKLAEDLLSHATRQADTAGLRPGVLTKGAQRAWNVAGMDTKDLGRRLFDEGVVAYDPTNPFGLQYSLAKAPKNAVVMDFEGLRRLADETGVPSMAEELFYGHFQPYQERILSSRIRQGYNYVFGAHSNADIIRSAFNEFIQRSAQVGVAPPDAQRVWNAWQDAAHESNLPKVVKSVVDAIPGDIRGRFTAYRAVPSDTALFASAKNIPNGKLLDIASKALGEEAGMYRHVPWDQVFREANSRIMQILGDSRLPLTDKLEAAYGKLTTNAALTFWYYVWRFGADIRYHAMNAMEGSFLYAGRAMLNPGTANPGFLGMTHDWLLRQGEDAMSNTGYPFSRSRGRWAEQAFQKEQMGVLRDAMGNLQVKDPGLLTQAAYELAAKDPELSRTIAAFGDTPETWLQATHDWYQKVLGSVDPGATIDAEIAAALEAEPAMAEVYGKLHQVQLDHWDNVKSTFFGNAERSRAERFLNSYLLFWPLSYQLKSARWMLRTMYDRAGGLPTNSLGAYQLDKMVGIHNKMLKDDPSYAAWIKANPALLFTAQALFPITPDSMGVSLSPLLRDAFFGRTKDVLNVGSVYTVHTFLPNLLGDLYPALKDVPGMNLVYRAFSGRKPTEPPVPSGIDTSGLQGH